MSLFSGVFMNKKFNKYNKYIFTTCAVAIPFTIGYSTWSINASMNEIDSTIKAGNVELETINCSISILLNSTDIYFSPTDSAKDQLEISITGHLETSYENFGGVMTSLTFKNEKDQNKIQNLISKGYIYFNGFQSLTKNSPLFNNTLENGSYWTSSSSTNREFKICSSFQYSWFFSYMNPSEFFKSTNSSGIKRGCDYAEDEINSILKEFNSLNTINYTINITSVPNVTPFYIIKFDLDGRTSTSNLTDNLKYQVNSTFTFPTSSESPIKTGKVFSHWEYTVNNEEKATFIPNQTIVLTKEIFGKSAEISFKAVYKNLSSTANAQNLFILNPSIGNGQQVSIRISNNAQLLNPEIYGIKTPSGYHFLGREFNGKCFPSTTTVNEENFPNSSKGDVFSLTALYAKDQVYVNFFSKEGVLLFQNQISINDNNNFKIPSENNLKEYVDGEITRVKLANYALYFNCDEEVPIDTLLSYNNNLSNLNFYVLTNPKSVEINYNFEDKTYVDFIDSFNKDTTYQLLPYSEIAESLGLTIKEGFQHSYTFRDTKTEAQENEQFKLNTVNFPFIDFDSTINIDVNEEDLSGITLYVHKSANAKLKAGNDVEFVTDQIAYDSLLTINFEDNIYYQTLKKFSKWTYYVIEGNEIELSGAQNKDLKLKIHESTEGLEEILNKKSFTLPYGAVIHVLRKEQKFF